MFKNKYQLEYASIRPQMYNQKSRILKAKRIIKTLQVYFETKSLKNLTVLDLGASTGIIANELSKHFKKIVATDIDKGGLKYAKKQFRRKNLIFKYADAMKMPFQNQSFDVVVCTHVYEHVPSPKKLFEEIHRVLKPDGVCYLAAQNKLWPLEAHHNLPFLSYLPKNLADLYIKTFRGKDEYYEHPMTYWQLTKTLNKFKIHDFTPHILREPQKFGYTMQIPFGNFLKYFTPTMFWIIEK